MDCQLDEAVKIERTQRVWTLLSRSASPRPPRASATADVIVDGVEETDDGLEFIGHAWFQAPDCDGRSISI